MATTQQTIDAVGGLVFGLSAGLFGAISLLQTFMARCPEEKIPGVRLQILMHGAMISLIQSVAYWGMFGGYGTTVRPGDGLTVQWGLILAWPFSWYYLGRALATYLWHLPYWADSAAYALAWAGTIHFLGCFVDTTTPGVQAVFYLGGLLFTLSAVYVAVVLRKRRDIYSVIVLVVAVVGVVIGFYLSYLLAEYFLNNVNGTGFSVWLLLANIVVYIVFIALLVFTGRDQKPVRSV